MLAGSTVLAAGPEEAAESFLPPPAGEREVRIPLEPLRLKYPLPDRFLADDGDRAMLRGRSLTGGKDYRLDRTRGEVHVLRPFQGGDTLVIRYHTLPLGLSTVYGTKPTWRRYQPPPPATGDAPDAPAVIGTGATTTSGPAPVVGLEPGRPASIPPAGKSEEPQLQISGNKSVVVETGNRKDANLQQSFDLSASGNLGGGVSLVALLSDRDTPLNETGTTLDLQELDKILVEVQAPVGKATLGDYRLQQRTGHFGVYEREFTGARLQGKLGGVSGQAAIAESKGRFHSMDFTGDEGRQGPYFLTDEAGNSPVPVVAGSEVVWLDGTRLTRGESADYWVDYVRGTLTFTPRRIISSASRISVDYQIALSPYKRMASHLSGGMDRGKLNLYGHAYREVDDVGSPTTFTLEKDDLEALAAAGEDPARALGSGVQQRPGDYEKRFDGAGTEYFAFAGRDSGSFDVEFVDLGMGQGSYVESSVVLGRMVYRYAGTGLGTHRPGRRLALPQEHTLLGGGGSLEILEDLRVEGEVAASRLDLNRLSNLSDGHDEGIAARGNIVAEPRLRLGGRQLGRLELRAGLERQDESFVPVARLDSPLFNEDWGLSADRDIPGRDTRQVSMAYHPSSRLQFGGERAWLRSADGYRADRWHTLAELSGRLSHRLRFDRVDSHDDSVAVAGRADGYRNKLMYAGSWRAASAFEPSFHLDHEDRVPPGELSRAIRYRAWQAGLRGAGGAFRWNGGYEFRRDFGHGLSDWYLKQTARTMRIETQANLRSGVALTVGANRRRTESATGAVMRSDNGYARFRQGGRTGRFRQDASFEWTAEALPRRLSEVVFVGEGAGHYDSLGNFRSGGDYDLRLSEDPESLDRLTRTVFSYRGVWQPGLGAGGKPAGSWWRDLRSTSTLQSSSSTRGAITAGNLFSLPQRIQNDPQVVLGAFLLRQEFEHVSRRPLELYLRFEYSMGADRRVETFAQSQESWAEEARLRWRRGRSWLWEVRGRASQSLAGVTVSSGTVQDRRLTVGQLTWQATYIPSERLRLVGTAELERMRGVAGAASEVGRIGPQAVYTIGNRFRADGQVRWAPWIQGETLPTLMPVAVAVAPSRFDFRVDLSYRLRELANLSLGWSGRERRGGSLVHIARGELRAYF
jgi:hypothetical protein